MLEKLRLVEERYMEMAERAGQPDFYADPKAASKLLREQKRLEPIVTAYRSFCKAKKEAEELREMLDAGGLDAEMKALCQEEYTALKKQLEELGENAAPVNVSDEKDRRVHELCQTHVHEIVLLEVNFGGTARALNDDHVVLRRKRFVCSHHVRQKFALFCVILHRAHVAAHLPVDDDLTADVGSWFQKDRVHAHIGLDAAGLRLHNLRPAHFAAVFCDEGIERHVLALEGRDVIAVLPENPAKRCGKQALSCVGHGSLQHDIQCHDGSSIARRMASASASFSSFCRTAMRYQPGVSPA